MAAKRALRRSLTVILTAAGAAALAMYGRSTCLLALCDNARADACVAACEYGLADRGPCLAVGVLARGTWGIPRAPSPRDASVVATRAEVRAQRTRANLVCEAGYSQGCTDADFLSARVACEEGDSAGCLDLNRRRSGADDRTVSEVFARYCDARDLVRPDWWPRYCGCHTEQCSWAGRGPRGRCACAAEESASMGGLPRLDAIAARRAADAATPTDARQVKVRVVEAPGDAGNAIRAAVENAIPDIAAAYDDARARCPGLVAVARLDVGFDRFGVPWRCGAEAVVVGASRSDAADCRHPELELRSALANWAGRLRIGGRVGNAFVGTAVVELGDDAAGLPTPRHPERSPWSVLGEECPADSPVGRAACE